YAVYRARDFRLSRTLWRGIRFNQHGSAFVYALRRFGWSILMVLTLGLVYPAMASSLWRYRYRHTWYGDRRFRWTGSWKTIAGPFYRNYFTSVAAVIAALVVVGGAGTVNVDGIQVPALTGLLAVFGAALVVFLGWFYFRSREATRMFSEVWIGDARATVKVRARALLGQFLLYVLALLAALVALAILAGIIAAGLFTNQIFTPGGSIAVDIAQMSQSSWLTVLGLVLGY